MSLPDCLALRFEWVQLGTVAGLQACGEATQPSPTPQLPHWGLGTGNSLAGPARSVEVYLVNITEARPWFDQ